MKRYSENMQHIYRRTLMPKCHFNKVALQLYWYFTSALVFSCRFAAYFQNTFSYEQFWTTACGVPKLNNSALNKKHGNQTQFYPKKFSRKRKTDLILFIKFTITIINGSCYRVIDLSTLQEFISSVAKCSSWNAESLELRSDNKEE